MLLTILLLRKLKSFCRFAIEPMNMIVSCVVDAFSNIQTLNNNLWIKQRVTSCGNQTHCPYLGSRLPSYRADRAVNEGCIIYLLTLKLTVDNNFEMSKRILTARLMRWLGNWLPRNG
ncbi:hypothetical protein SFRURICE_014814 [Spodoptera frugiperda]|nr:hypothetical protein SFRURICE_014814 [Spodoptera frugiperda]